MMTSQEAKQKINACEAQITNTHNSLCIAARSVGSSASEVASNKTTTKTLAPLTVSLFGLILLFADHPWWGILFIIIGAVISYNMHDTAKSTQTAIENQQKNLDTAIDHNHKI